MYPTHRPPVYLKLTVMQESAEPAPVQEAAPAKGGKKKGAKAPVRAAKPKMRLVPLSAYALASGADTSNISSVDPCHRGRYNAEPEDQWQKSRVAYGGDSDTMLVAETPDEVMALLQQGLGAIVITPEHLIVRLADYAPAQVGMRVRLRVEPPIDASPEAEPPIGASPEAEPPEMTIVAVHNDPRTRALRVRHDDGSLEWIKPELVTRVNPDGVSANPSPAAAGEAALGGGSGGGEQQASAPPPPLLLADGAEAVVGMTVHACTDLDPINYTPIFATIKTIRERGGAPDAQSNLLWLCMDGHDEGAAWKPSEVFSTAAALEAALAPKRECKPVLLADGVEARVGMTVFALDLSLKPARVCECVLDTIAPKSAYPLGLKVISGAEAGMDARCHAEQAHSNHDAANKALQALNASPAAAGEAALGGGESCPAPAAIGPPGADDDEEEVRDPIHGDPMEDGAETDAAPAEPALAAS